MSSMKIKTMLGCLLLRRTSKARFDSTDPLPASAGASPPFVWRASLVPAKAGSEYDEETLDAVHSGESAGKGVGGENGSKEGAGVELYRFMDVVNVKAAGHLESNSIQKGLRLRTKSADK